MSRRRVIARVFASAFFWGTWWAFPAAAEDVQTRAYVAEIGGTGAVDVALADAAGVASISLRVNYDPNVLELLAVTNKPGTLGAEFNLQGAGGDGTADVVLTRTNALPSGSGTLATLLFRVNPGTPPGTVCELPVARHEMSGELGAALASPPEGGSGSAGTVWLVKSFATDTDGDAVPDWWEALNFGGLTTADAGLDTDGDGHSNRSEYRAGTDPFKRDDSLRMKKLAKPEAGAGLVVRWASVSAKTYTIERSTDLRNGFEVRASGVLATPPENCITDQTANVDSPCFYRITVE